MLSMSDIASVKTSRGIVLIGPLVAFGEDAGEIVLRYPDDIRRVVDHLFWEFPDGSMVRALLRRWGLDPNVATRSDRTFLPRWITDQAMAGALGIVEETDPILAFAAYADSQEEVQKTVAAAWKRKHNALGGPKPAAAANAGALGENSKLPIALEERLLIVLEMVEDELSGVALQEFKEIDPVRLASGLLTWIGTQFEDGLELSVLAFDLAYLSDLVIRAIWDIADAIADTAGADTRTELEEIAADLAHPIRLLLAEEVLSRFISAARVTHGRQEQDGKRTKPNPPKHQHRRLHPHHRDDPKPKPKPDPPMPPNNLKLPPQFVDNGADLVKNSDAYKGCIDSVKDQIKSKPFTEAEQKHVNEVLKSYENITSCSNQPLKKIGRTDKAITRGTSGCFAETNTMGEAFSDQNGVVLTDAATNLVDFKDKDTQFKGTAAHEFAHALLNTFDPRTCTSYDDYLKNPLMQEYMTAAGWDPTGTTLTETAKNKAASNYGKTNPKEDLSEAMMYYLYDPEKLKKDSPERYAFCEKLLKGKDK